jgi:hypothetical protein
MNARLENPMVREQPEQSSAAIEAEFDYQVARWLDRVTPTDVLDQMCEHEDELQRLMVAGDAVPIGKLVLSVRLQYARDLAAQGLVVL